MAKLIFYKFLWTQTYLHKAIIRFKFVFMYIYLLININHKSDYLVKIFIASQDRWFKH